MNLISNNCAGARFYQMNNMEFTNPFMWCCIFADDFISLVKQYDNINFSNIKDIFLTKEVSDYNKYNLYDESKHISGINVDGIFSVYYTHYIYDEKYKEPTKSGVDILYYKNCEYSHNKYIERLNRMIMNGKPPVFFAITYTRHGWTSDKINELLNIDTNYKIFLVTDEHISSSNKNFEIRVEDGLNTKYFFPFSIVKKYKRDIESLLK